MIKAYFEKLKTETSWFKIFRPLFIGLTIVIEIFTPIVLYIYQVLIMHQELNLPSFWYGLGASLIISAFFAWIISENHRKLQEAK